MMFPNVRTVAALMTICACGILAACSSPDQRVPPPASPVADTTSPTSGSAGRLFVTNETSGDLSVVDLATFRVVKTIPLGKRPRGVRASPDHSKLYVALSGSPLAPPGVDESTLPPPDKKADGIGVVDVAEGRLLTILPGGSDPEQLAVSPDGRRLYVANEDAAQASVIDAADGHVISTFKVGGEPEGVNLSPDGRMLVVTSEEDGEVFLFDTIALRPTGKIRVGPRPRSTAFLPDNIRAYVPAENGSSISVIDVPKHKVISTIMLAGEMVKPMGTVVSPDGKRLFVTTGRGRTVVIIDTATNQPVGSIEVGERPWGIDISSDGRTVFTANGTSNDVSIVDVDGRVVKQRVKVGERPWGVAYVP